MPFLCLIVGKQARYCKIASAMTPIVRITISSVSRISDPSTVCGVSIDFFGIWA